MADLKIRVFKGTDKEPETTLTIPAGILKFASKIIPPHAASAIKEKGVDLNAIMDLSQNPDAHGTLIEIEDHKKNQRVVIAME